MSRSMEDLLRAVEERTCEISLLGSGLRETPTSRPTAIPSSTTLVATCLSPVTRCRSPFESRVSAEIGLIAEFTIVLDQSTPLMSLLTCDAKPALRNTLLIARDLFELLPSSSPTQVLPLPVWTMFPGPSDIAPSLVDPPRRDAAPSRRDSVSILPSPF